MENPIPGWEEETAPHVEGSRVGMAGVGHKARPVPTKPKTGNGEGAALIPNPPIPAFGTIFPLFSLFFIPFFTFHNAGEGGRVPGHEELQLLVQVAGGEVDVPGANP